MTRISHPSSHSQTTGSVTEHDTQYKKDLDEIKEKVRKLNRDAHNGKVVRIVETDETDDGDKKFGPSWE